MACKINGTKAKNGDFLGYWRSQNFSILNLHTLIFNDNYGDRPTPDYGIP